jgi:CTP synthase
MVYKSVIERERNLGYGGKCVEAVPHVRDEIMNRIIRAAEKNQSEILLVEVGGTVGDFQNALFIDAARVMKAKNPDDVACIMVSYMPVPGKIGEMKTRPTQHAVSMLNSYGVQPDVIIARSELSIDQKRKEKIAIACNVRAEHVIAAPDIDSVYEVPLNFEKEHIGEILLDILGLKAKNGTDLKKWKSFVATSQSATEPVNIAIVGKYFDTGDFMLSDAYLSVIEAIKFSAYHWGRKPVIHWLNAKDFASDKKGDEKKKVEELKQYDGIIVPGGFGETGIEGKINVIRFARENKIPYFGLCYGMQLMTVEYARNVLGLKGAHTVEIDPDTDYPIIDIMPDQKKLIADAKYGGTMRLGIYPAQLKKGTLARTLYGKDEIEERHRHRYEVNPEFIPQLEQAGLVFSGTSPNNILMEIAELPADVHPFFLGTQFHPEFHARPLDPHPLFNGFIKASIENKK